MRFHWTLLIYCVGCNRSLEDLEPANFDDADKTSIGEALFVSGLGDVVFAIHAGMSASIDADDGSCPVIVEKSDDHGVVDAGGGCTTDDGTTYEGSISWTDEVITFDAFAIPTHGYDAFIDDVAFDGVIRMSETDARAIELESTIGDGEHWLDCAIAVSSGFEGSLEVHGDFEPGARGSIRGLGSFDIVRTEEGLELTGADSVVFTDAPENCTAYATSSGKSGILCSDDAYDWIGRSE